MFIHSVKFLLVDDLEANLLALAALLRRDGLELLTARSGADALELLLVHDVALVFLDVQMPEMSGFELAELMRGTERTRRVPIIFVTAGATDSQRRFRGYELGAVDFLFKPIDPAILQAKAEVFFELAQQRNHLAAAAEENARLIENLQASEARYRAVVENQSEMVCRFQRDGTILFVNQAYAHARGETAEALIGGNFWQPIARDDESALRTGLANISRTEPEVRIETRFGSRWTLWSTRALHFDDAGHWLEAQSTGVDISDRKQAEEMLRRSYDTFFSLIQNAPFGVYLVDAHFRLAQVSIGAQKVFSTVRPLLGRDFAEVLEILWPQPFASEAAEHFRRTLATGMPYRSPATTEQRQDTGEIESYDWQLERVTLPDGQFGVVCYFYDMTALKRAEQALRESEERFRNMADHSPVMVWVTDAHGACIYLNQRWSDFTGRAAETSQGFAWLQAIHPEDRDRSEKALRGAILERKPFRVELRLRRHDGAYRWAMDTAVPRFGPAGDFLGYIGSRVEIDDQKRAAEKLEQTVAERTTELRESNEQLEAFVYSIAHDLRAPLRSMNGYSQLLLDDHAAALDEVGRTLLKRVQGSSDFMDRMLLDLLAFGRTARSAIELGPVRVAVAWQNALAQCAAQIDQSAAQVNGTELLPVVRAHEATLSQCLANLLSNALKFVRDGVRPRIGFWTTESDGQVRLWVEDNGIGIPADQHDRIFRVFERMHGTRYPGTGIGLSIVRKGVERMGGQMGLESAPGVGSRFWIQLAKAS